MARIHSRSEYDGGWRSQCGPGNLALADVPSAPRPACDPLCDAQRLFLAAAPTGPRRLVSSTPRRPRRRARGWPPGTARRRSATSARRRGTAAARAGRTPMPTLGCRRLSSSSSGWMIRSSRRAPNQSSTLGSSDPLATTSIAQPSSVAAAPTPMNSVLPTARSRKNALARTMSTTPMVNTNSARPRRVRLECRTPAHDHQRQREHHVEQRQQPRQRHRAGRRGCAADTPRAPSRAAGAR